MCLDYKHEKIAHDQGVQDCLSVLEEILVNHLEPLGCSVLVINRIKEQIKKVCCGD